MALYFQDERTTLHYGDALAVLSEMPDQSADCIVTSPPYFGLRDYGIEGQIGAEASPAEFVAAMVAVFREARRVLADDGTLWLNLGDSYSGSGGNGQTNRRTQGKAPTNRRNRAGATENGNLPPRSLMGIPWKVATALQHDGWILRQEIIWAKPNGMPSNAPGRYESRHEHVFLFAKSWPYWFSPDARAFGQSDVWTYPTESLPGAHVAVMPAALAERCVLAGCKTGGTVLDPFSGSGTTGYAASKHDRRYVGIDLNAEYLDLSLRTRLAQPALSLGGTA